MKKTIVIASMLVIIGVLCGYFVGWTVGKAGCKCENLSADIVSEKPTVTDVIDINDETEDSKLQASGAISRIDYPIVELYFKKNKTYKMVVKDFFNDFLYRLWCF